MEKEKSNNGLILLVIILFLLSFVLGGYIVYDKFISKDETKELQSEIKELKLELQALKENSQSTTNGKISIADLYGTYSWEKNYINENGVQMNLKIKLVLNSDGTATYDASSGMETEKTKGLFVYENGKVTYTREYYNYNETNSTTTNEAYTDQNNKTETFTVIDKDTLENTYYDQPTTLKKIKK